MNLPDVPLCPDCGHSAALHHEALTRGDGCIGVPQMNGATMASLADIRAGHACGCPVHADTIDPRYGP